MFYATDNLKDQLMSGLVFGLDASMNRDMYKLVEISESYYRGSLPLQDRSLYRVPVFGFEDLGPSDSELPTWEFDTEINRWCHAYLDTASFNNYFSLIDENETNYITPMPSGSDTFSFGAWVYMDSTSKDAVHQTIVTLGDNSAYQRFQLYRHKTSGKIYIDCHTAAISTSGTIAQDEWHYIGVRHYGGEQIQNAFEILIDGEVQTLDASSETNTLNLGTVMALIGASNDTGKGLNGKTANLCFWRNRIVSDSEFKVLSRKSFNQFERDSRSVVGLPSAGGGGGGSNVAQQYYNKFIARM